MRLPRRIWKPAFLGVLAVASFTATYRLVKAGKSWGPSGDAARMARTT
jgi:hypothetical protein